MITNISHNRKYLPFVEARKNVRPLGLKSQSEWRRYCRTNEKSPDIPADPTSVYKNEWINWGDWLGTGIVATFDRKFRSFIDAREFVRSMRFKSQTEFRKYIKSGQKPADLPTHPDYTYKKEWINWGDWLGTHTIANQKKEYRSFEEARKFVNSLGLKSRIEWLEYCKSKRKATDLPNYPAGVYKTKWKGWRDWLGTVDLPSRKNRSFEEARKYIQLLGLKSVNEWKEYCKQGKRPKDIPSSPNKVYKKEWKGFENWLGIEFLPFEEARKFVHKLGLRSQTEWKEYCSSGKKPVDIPSNANAAMDYKKRWKGWGDWLGTGTIAPRLREYRSFEEAKKFVHSLRLKNTAEWRAYLKSEKKPLDIPNYPDGVYKKEWNGWGDWLGTGYVAHQNREYRSFEEAKKFVHTLGLKNWKDWSDYRKSGKKPADIPGGPYKIYKGKWKSWGDWLGTGTIAGQLRDYRPFEEAKKFVHSLGLRNTDEWIEYSKSEKKPADIPADPRWQYKKEWRSMGDWLGTGSVASFNKEYRAFEEAKQFVHSLGIKGQESWFLYCNTGSKPQDIPSNPNVVYEENWYGWPDWLGYEESVWSVRKVKELLRDLIESKIIYQWDEAVLYSFLLRKGLLEVCNNRHGKFFKNLIEASRSSEGRKAIEEYANSDSENPPDLSQLVPVSSVDLEQEIQKASSQELAQLENTDPLDYGEFKTAEHILANTNVLESINVDEEAMQFYLDYSIDEIWKSAFTDKEKTIEAVKKEGKNGNKYHDAVVDTFLSDYQGTQSIKKPNGYAFPHDPTLMQLYVSYKVKTTNNFGNFSGTGAGKTLSAVLASRVVDSKMTVIVCPNDVVNQWADSIVEAFRDSKTVTGKDAFFTEYDENKYQYLVLNYDKFSQGDSPNLILNLAKEKIDFVILDEIHFVKKRDEDSSLRRKNLDGLMTAVRKRNNKVKVLGLSATPVVNNLMEGRSLLELITGKVYDDVAIRPTIPNAVTLYEKLSTISIRELPKYNIDVDDKNIIEVEAEKPPDISIKQLKKNPLAIEQFLTDTRIPEIIRHIEDQTIIYTEYVTDVIAKLSTAVKEAGYRYALYTGSDYSGLKRFLDKKVQVLIASRPISVGIDGLQHICNRLIINTLPWTNAQYQQLLGRLVRKGQIRDVVHVYIIKASVKGCPYDELKWKRIQFKRTLADCAVDGRLPERNLVTPQQAAMEAVKWLERLERGEVSSVIRRDLNVELTPVEIERRIRKYGDFTRLNNQINSENSETTHERMLKDPREWEEYHRQYRQARKTWSVIPYDEIIKRIKQLFTSRMLSSIQIGDFGCGEAKIMEAFEPKRVYSFDHVAINDRITVCDMKNTGLADDILDVAVFSLSLMSKNWTDYIIEAKRCLATNGYLLIVETTKSLKGRLSKLRDVLREQGFDLYTDEERGDFTVIEAREL